MDNHIPRRLGRPRHSHHKGAETLEQSRTPGGGKSILWHSDLQNHFHSKQRDVLCTSYIGYRKSEYDCRGKGQRQERRNTLVYPIQPRHKQIYKRGRERTCNRSNKYMVQPARLRCIATRGEAENMDHCRSLCQFTLARMRSYGTGKTHILSDFLIK